MIFFNHGGIRDSQRTEERASRPPMKILRVLRASARGPVSCLRHDVIRCFQRKGREGHKDILPCARQWVFQQMRPYSGVETRSVAEEETNSRCRLNPNWPMIAILFQSYE